MLNDSQLKEKTERLANGNDYIRSTTSRKPLVENQLVEKPSVENLPVENQPLLSTKELSTNIQSSSSSSIFFLRK